MAERVWRVRRHHTWMDAQIQDDDGAGGSGGPESVVLICYDGEPIYTRRWPTRDLARADAESRLHDLLRAGWATHW